MTPSPGSGRGASARAPATRPRGHPSRPRAGGRLRVARHARSTRCPPPTGGGTARGGRQRRPPAGGPGARARPAVPRGGTEGGRHSASLTLRRARWRPAAPRPRGCPAGGRRGRRGGSRRSRAGGRAGQRRALPPGGASMRRSPRWTCPSAAPSALARMTGPASRASTTPQSCSSAAAAGRRRSSRGLELRRLAAQRGHRDGVLEQPAGVRVVAELGGRRAARKRSRKPGSSRTARDQCAQRGVVQLVGQEVDVAVELVGVAAGAGTSSSGSPGSTCSTSRSSSSSRPAYSLTRPSTRTVSPTSKRPSSSGTASQTRPGTRPERSASSRSRKGARPCAGAARFCVTANVPSTSEPGLQVAHEGRSGHAPTSIAERHRVRRPARGRRPSASRGTVVRPFRALRFDPARVRCRRRRRAALRRHRRGAPRAPPGAEPVQRRPPDPARARATRPRRARSSERWIDEGILIREASPSACTG